MAQDTDLLFSTDDWVEIYRTADEWEVRLIQATLGNQQIRCRPVHHQRQHQTILFVSPDDQVEALEIVSQIGLAIANSQHVIHQDEREQQPRTHSAVEESELPKATPTAVEEMVIAEREGIGNIVHYINRGYELQVGPEPYGIVEEDRWEEFTDFSAQRQEFSILLKHEYPTLFQWLKQKKLMAEFIRLVESTYRDVPPPRLQRNRRQSSPADLTDVTDAKTYELAKLSFGLSLVSLLLIVSLPWYVSFTFALLAFITGFIAKYQIDASDGRLKGTLLAFIAGFIACIVIVIALTWKQHQTSQAGALDRQSARLFTH